MKIAMLGLALTLSLTAGATDSECLNSGTLERIEIKGNEVQFEVRDMATIVSLKPGKTGAPVGDEPGGVQPGELRTYSAPLKKSTKAACDSELLKTLLQARDGKVALCVDLDPGRIVRGVSIRKEHSVLVRPQKGNH